MKSHGRESNVHLDRYWLYAVECIPTGKIYIGQTRGVSPFPRWSEHFAGLKRGYSTSPLLQAEWTRHPELPLWRFRALDRVFGRIAANQREAELILAVSERDRLNVAGRSTVSLVRQRRVVELLKAGLPYKEIQMETGLTPGTISKIKTRLGVYREKPLTPLE